MIPHPSQLDLALKLLMPQTLPRHRILERVPHDRLLLPLMALVPTPFPARFGGSDVLETDDALGKTPCKLPGVVAEDGFRDGDGGQEPITRGGDGGEFGVIGADALDAVHFHIDALPRPHLGEQDIRMHGSDRVVLAGEELILAAGDDEVELFGVDVGVIVEEARVVFALLVEFGVVVGFCAFDLEFQDDGVPVRDAAAIGVFVSGFFELLEPAEAGGVAGEGDEAEAVGEDFVLDDGGIVVNEDVFDGEGGDFGEEDAAEGVCNGGVDADQGEGSVVGGEFMEFDVEGLGV